VSKIKEIVQDFSSKDIFSALPLASLPKTLDKLKFLGIIATQPEPPAALSHLANEERMANPIL